MRATRQRRKAQKRTRRKRKTCKVGAGYERYLPKFLTKKRPSLSNFFGQSHTAKFTEEKQPKDNDYTTSTERLNALENHARYRGFDYNGAIDTRIRYPNRTLKYPDDREEKTAEEKTAEEKRAKKMIDFNRRKAIIKEALEINQEDKNGWLKLKDPVTEQFFYYFRDADTFEETDYDKYQVRMTDPFPKEKWPTVGPPLPPRKYPKPRVAIRPKPPYDFNSNYDNAHESATDKEISSSDDKNPFQDEKRSTVGPPLPPRKFPKPRVAIRPKRQPYDFDSNYDNAHESATDKEISGSDDKNPFPDEKRSTVGPPPQPPSSPSKYFEDFDYYDENQ